MNGSATLTKVHGCASSPLLNVAVNREWALKVKLGLVGLFLAEGG